MKRLKAFCKRLCPMKPAEVSPRVFLEEMLENHHNFKAVMVVIQYHDDTMSCDWSKMETRDLSMACVVLDDQLRRNVIERGVR